MTKSELIEALAARQKHLGCQRRRAGGQERDRADEPGAVARASASRSAASAASRCITDRRAWAAIPKTGDAVALPGKHVPHFKPGKELRERVNDGAQSTGDGK